MSSPRVLVTLSPACVWVSTARTAAVAAGARADGPLNATVRPDAETLGVDPVPRSTKSPAALCTHRPAVVAAAQSGIAVRTTGAGSTGAMPEKENFGRVVSH